MDFAELKTYLLDKPHARLDFPFDKETHVFKVKGKMFALVGFRDDKLNMNLKCVPEEGAALRDIFSNVKPGYHMNKRHWITVYFHDNTDPDNNVPDGEVFRLIDRSYQLVVNNLPKKEQRSIQLHIE